MERDLQTLTTASQLKSIRVEMIGWGRAIRQISTDGLAAAKLSLDTVNQDRAMTARRKLAEYGRLSRYVGTLTEGSALYFRRFARSCDSLAGLILVAIGEGLAANGITRSTKIVRVAASELHARREAVLRALSGLIGTSESADGLPRGIAAYGQLLTALDGRPELSTLLEENTLAAAMDRLVEFSTSGSVEGLRELASISASPVGNFQDIIGISNDIMNDPMHGIDSPPLQNFVTSLELFVGAFIGRDSSRILHIARPAILSGGLYDIAGSEGATRLQALASARGALVAQIEELAGCGCDFNAAASEVMLDYLLFQLDRAIDLTAAGTDINGRGKAEKRAAAVGLIFENAPLIVDKDAKPYFAFSKELTDVLKYVRDTLIVPFRPKAWEADVIPYLVQELVNGSAAEERGENLVRSLSPGAHSRLFNLAADEVRLPGGSTNGERSSRSLVRSMLAETARVRLEVAVIDIVGRMPLMPTLARTVYGALPRIADSIENIEEHVIKRPGPGPDPDPGNGSGPDGDSSGGQEPGEPTEPGLFEDDLVVALYAVAIGPKGGFSVHAAGKWLREATSETGGKHLRDIVEWEEGMEGKKRRESFINAAVGVAADFQGLPQRLSREQIGRFFDLAPVILEAIIESNSPQAGQDEQDEV
ncbi:hypothetical protein [Rhizobium sp. 768_B6_N1_8]|uniref:hypothetical protein n=1 Tax=unclassified Rhizobium TaxID=2613769 RepID=UPI003F2940CE